MADGRGHIFSIQQIPLRPLHALLWMEGRIDFQSFGKMNDEWDPHLSFGER